MLDWLGAMRKKGKDAHPFQSDKGIEDALRHLPASQPLVVLGEIGNWLADVEGLRADLEPRTLARVVCRFDEHAQPALAEAWFAMLTEARGEGLREDAWQTLTNFAGHAAHAYCTVIEALFQAGLLAELDRKALALLAKRALQALVQKARLLRMRYRYPDPALWKRLHELFVFGRDQAINHLPLRAYPNEEASTLLTEYLAGLLVEMAPVESLSPQQIAGAGLLIGRYKSDIPFRDQAGNHTPFCVDIVGAAPPRRVSASEGLAQPRFFGAGTLPVHLGGLARTIEREQSVPDWLEASGCTVEELLGLCRMLREHWSDKPPARRHSRRRTEAMLFVTHGFVHVRRMVAASTYARSGRKIGYKSYAEIMSVYQARFGQAGEPRPAAEPEDEAQTPKEVLSQLELAGDRQMMEEWGLLDISEAGMGAQVPHHKKWLGIGVLIGFRLAESLDWRVGIIRRLGRTIKGQRQAGVEVLSGTPVSAEYRRLDEEQTGPWVDIPEAMGTGMRHAILVSRIHRTLVVERHDFGAGRPFRLVVGGASSYHRFARLIGQGKDFALVEYEDAELPSTPHPHDPS